MSKFKAGDRYTVGAYGDTVIEIKKVDCDRIHFKTIKGETGRVYRFQIGSMFDSSLKPCTPQNKIIITTNDTCKAVRWQNNRQKRHGKVFAERYIRFQHRCESGV